MNDGVPNFACVGAVNTGKTSTIAALIEDDQLRITNWPGETTACQTFTVELAGQPIVRFFDTPGFQNAKTALAELRKLEDAAGDPLDAFRRFLDAHGGDERFSEEVKLFRPLVEGAGILYVVDASQPFREINDAEMKILLLSGRPRMGLINTTAEPEHAAVWQARLGQHFNLVRTFDAHAADYHARMELLRALMGIHEHWRDALARAVALYESDWTRRRDESAEVIAELLIEAVQHRETAAVGITADSAAVSATLVDKFKASTVALERRAHQRIIGIYKHRELAAGPTGGALAGLDLFSEDVWRLGGLDGQQLVVAATVTGALGGAALDVALAGHTFGAVAVVGGALGGAGAWLTGKVRPHLEVTPPGRLGQFLGRQKVAGRDLQVGPLRAINFPWILLDRALAVAATAAARSHARRNEREFSLPDQLAVLRGRGLLTQEWPPDVRKDCEKIFALARRGRAGFEERERLRNAVGARMARA